LSVRKRQEHKRLEQPFRRQAEQLFRKPEVQFFRKRREQPSHKRAERLFRKQQGLPFHKLPERLFHKQQAHKRLVRLFRTVQRDRTDCRNELPVAHRREN
jgi:hypothetical protein